MDIITRHRQALDDWSHAQHLSQCVPVAHRPVVGPVAALMARIPVLGSVIRSLQRVRYLGALSQRQLTLNQVDLEEAQFQGHFATSANEVLATLQREMAQVLVYQRTMGPPAALRTQMADIGARQAALEKRLQGQEERLLVQEERLLAQEERLLGLHETLLQSEARHNTLESQLSLETTRIEADLSRVTSELRQEIERNASTAAAATGEIAALQHAMRMQSGQLRLLRHELQVAAPVDLQGEDDSVQYATLLPALIGLLENEMPELREAGDIGLAIQGRHMEDALFALFTYFGGRLATTVDAIVSSRVFYHIDFSSSWNYDEVFEGAARKLVPGGHFVVITGSTNKAAPEPAGFSPVADRVLSVGSATARAAVWRHNGSGASDHREEAPDRATV